MEREKLVLKTADGREGLVLAELGLHTFKLSFHGQVITIEVGNKKIKIRMQNSRCLFRKLKKLSS